MDVAADLKRFLPERVWPALSVSGLVNINIDLDRHLVVHLIGPNEKLRPIVFDGPRFCEGEIERMHLLMSDVGTWTPDNNLVLPDSLVRVSRIVRFGVVVGFSVHVREIGSRQ